MALGLALRIPDSRVAVQRIRKERYLPLAGRPLQIKNTGAVVACLQHAGTVALIARAVRLEGPTPVRLVGGERKNTGFKLWLSEIKQPKRIAPLKFEWYAIGQFRYFDLPRWIPTVIGDPDTSWHGDHMEESVVDQGSLDMRRGGFTGTVQGKPKSHPESQLVRRFVAWLACEGDMEQHRLMPDRFQTDLFDASRWRLIEAKVANDRFTLREAVGQLLDYKRYYRRRPSLGVLVSRRPGSRNREYLTDQRITVVWETAKGQFRDSSAGAWSVLRRGRGGADDDHR